MLVTCCLVLVLIAGVVFKTALDYIHCHCEWSEAIFYRLS